MGLVLCQNVGGVELSAGGKSFKVGLSHKNVCFQSIAKDLLKNIFFILQR